MTNEKAKKPARKGSTARLHLNGKDVGQVNINGADNSWNYGDFTPDDAFGEFAPVFGQWSLLIHADGDANPLSRDASDELRQTEYLIDSMRAKLVMTDSGETSRISQVNIDGSLIEWKDA